MTFDGSVGLGSILVLITMVVGGLGAFFTLRGDAKETGNRVTALEDDHAKMTEKINAIELSVARDCVKKPDIEAVEARLMNAIRDGIGGIGERLRTVEHSTKSIETKLTDRLLSVLNRGARE